MKKRRFNISHLTSHAPLAFTLRKVRRRVVQRTCKIKHTLRLYLQPHVDPEHHGTFLKYPEKEGNVEMLSTEYNGWIRLQTHTPHTCVDVVAHRDATFQVHMHVDLERDDSSWTDMAGNCK